MGPRAAGILLHPTSLPGPHGIGELGPEATRVPRLPGGDRAEPLAGAAARPHRLRRLAVPVLLGLRRQPAARHPRPPARRGPALRGGPEEAARLPGARGRLRGGHRLEGARSSRRPAPPSRRRRRPRGARPSRPSCRATRLARRLRALHGPQAGERRGGLEQLGPRARRTASRARSRGPGGSSRARSREVEFEQWLFFEQWARACGGRRGSAASASWATSRSSSPTTAPTSGRTRSSSTSPPTGARRSRPACRPTTSARPASSGATRSTAGTPWPATGYAWWIDRFRARPSSSSTWCASTTSAASRPTGRCRATRRPRSTGAG